MNQLPEFFRSQSSEMQLAAQAAWAAGEIIRNGYRNVHQIEAKGVGDLVSQIDFEADRAATKILTSSSSLPIMSEELSPEADDVNQRMWVVDPLDGTTAYLMAAGPQFSSVLISICEAGEPVLGITYFPMTDEWFYASKNEGAWKNGNLLKMTPQSYSLKLAWIEMNQYGDSAFETEFFTAARNVLRSKQGAQIVTSTFPHAGVAMRIAEQSNGLCAAMHDNNPTSLKQGPWDIAANQIIFEEAGGVFLNAKLERVSPFVAEPFLITPNKELAEQILACVANACEAT